MSRLSPPGDRIALIVAGFTVRWLPAGELAGKRAEVAALIGRYEPDGDGMRFERRHLALLDAEIRRRARQADLWGSP